MEAFPNFPEIIDPSIIMTEVNQKIMIYEGAFILKTEKYEIAVNGIIHYKWFPEPRVYYSCTTSKDNFGIIHQITLEKISLIIDKLEFGKGYISSTNFNSELNDLQVNGFCFGQIVKGDKSIPVDCVRFSIPNLRLFHGLPVKKKTHTQEMMSTSRLVFETNDYSIIFDSKADYKKLDEYSSPQK